MIRRVIEVVVAGICGLVLGLGFVVMLATLIVAIAATAIAGRSRCVPDSYLRVRRRSDHVSVRVLRHQAPAACCRLAACERVNHN